MDSAAATKLVWARTGTHCSYHRVVVCIAELTEHIIHVQLPIDPVGVHMLYAICHSVCTMDTAGERDQLLRGRRQGSLGKESPVKDRSITTHDQVP